jgi:hypothetical protein
MTRTSVPSTNAADVSHWWISDDFNSPQKYRLPAGSIIPAGGYLVARITKTPTLVLFANSSFAKQYAIWLLHSMCFLAPARVIPL